MSSPRFTLNPNAAPFTPSASPTNSWAYTEDSEEQNISQAELDELEAAEAWVAQLASFEEDAEVEEGLFVLDAALGAALDDDAAPPAAAPAAPAAAPKPQ